MTYASPAWELVADTYLIKFKRMQNKVIISTGYFRLHTVPRTEHGFH
jgi:hypothetical protein